MAKIKHWLLHGDCHGWFGWIDTQLKDYPRKETAVIILGNAGFNYYMNKNDIRTKREVDAKSYYIYCVRGNHEMRPQHLDFIVEEYDKNVGGNIYYETEFPHIRYFKDYGIYTINGYRCLIIGGAYSVDKWYRLSTAGINNPGDMDWQKVAKKSGWFFDEQLTAKEMEDCENMIAASGDNRFDFLFSHTCPLEFQPTDLFLGFIDQKTVDSAMEVWMNDLYKKIQADILCFGHYHKDRLERPHIEQYYNDIEELDTIYYRWAKYDEEDESIEWWLEKSPNYYMR